MTDGRFRSLVLLLGWSLLLGMGCGENVDIDQTKLHHTRVLELYPQPDGVIGAGETVLAVFLGTVTVGSGSSDASIATFHVKDASGATKPANIDGSASSSSGGPAATSVIMQFAEPLTPGAYEIFIDGRIRGAEHEPIGTNITSPFTVQ